MRKKVIGILIVCLYCFPYVYFSMYQDYANSSLRGYLIMIIVTSLLAFIGKYSNNTLALIIGNIISVIVSFYFIISKMKGIEYWDFYKMPPSMLLIIVTVLNLIPQFLAVKLANTLKNKGKD